MNILNFLFGSAKVENTDLVLGEIGLAFIVMLLAFVAPFIIRKVAKKERPWIYLLSSAGKVIGYGALLVLLALILRFEAIYPFETRGWVTVILFGTGIALAWALLRYRRIAPTLVVDTTRYEHYDRYLPKQKKK